MMDDGGKGYIWGVMTEGSNEGMRSDSTYVAHVVMYL
jgi:hypothetical protein